MLFRSVGDWVWVVFQNNVGFSTYRQKTENNDKSFCQYKGNFVTDFLNYSNYGTKWLAYKNKEQAERKGDIIELPTIISFPDMHPFLGKITTYQVIWLSKLLGIRHEKYTTPEQAERRLAELKGENNDR